MATRTLDSFEVHSFAVSKYTVSLAITGDGHVASAHGDSPAECRARLADWLATLPALPDVTPAPGTAP